MNPEFNSTSEANGNGPARAAAQAQHDTPATGTAETQIEYETREGAVVNGQPLHLTRHAAVFELYSPLAPPQFSEALANFKIALRKRSIYAGRAVVHNVMATGLKTVCGGALAGIRGGGPV